ncbi:MAG: Fpg/Nei family DNA glycosylase [Alphaproteobacteria bacterium]|nr:Fpg/Nei family DNA glycosylase [Alphaproteobacteria bacterium]
MPERPELDYVVPILHRALTGRRVASVEVLNPVLLRVAMPGDPTALLVGRTITGVVRRAHFVRLLTDASPEIAIAPMLAGRFLLCPPSRRVTRDTGLRLGFEGLDDELRYRDDKQMGKVYLLPHDQLHLAPGLAEVGVDVLAPEFTVTRLRRLGEKRRDQVKLFLLDKAALDALGNAYADEALFAAGLHPKRRCSSLSEDEWARLHAAIVSVLQEATAEVARRAPPLDAKVRDFLKVRNRKGQPCPVCGSKIRAAGVRGHDAFFCPRCQPTDTGLVDWRKAGR